MNTCDIEPEFRNTGLSVLVWVAVFLMRQLVDKKYIHYCVYRKDVILKQLHHLETCREWGHMLMIRSDSLLLWRLNCETATCVIFGKKLSSRIGFLVFSFPSNFSLAWEPGAEWPCSPIMRLEILVLYLQVIIILIR